MKHVSWILIVFVCISLKTQAQEYYFLKSTLIERGTTNPVPFANVLIAHTGIGTAANANGEFELKIDKQFKTRYVKISCIGYVSKTMSIDSVLKQTPTTIELSPDVNLLDEVVINQAPVNPAEVVTKAIESVKDNYLNTPFNMEFLSKIVATNYADSSEFILETILFGYNEGYATVKQKQFEILERRSTGTDFLKSVNYPYWPTFEIHNVDQIANSIRTGILNPSHLKKFNLKYLGASLFDTDTVYHIEYDAPKPTKEITGFGIVPKIYKGSIYITTNTHAIVKHEIETDQFSYMIIYKKIEEKYFPYFIHGARAPRGIVLLGKVQNSLTLRNIDTKNVKAINYKTNEFEPVDKVNYNESFWNTNYSKQ